MTGRIRVQQRTIFSGKESHQYKLACGPLILETPKKDLLCAWLSGGDLEPATDNCVLISRSTDKGQTWSEAETLFPAGKMAAALTSWHCTSNGRIILFAAHWPSEKCYTIWHYFRQESADSGYTWSEPTPLTFHNNRASVESPSRLSNGEYLFAASFFEERAQPLVGPVEKLVDIDNEAQALAVPAGEGKTEPAKFWTHLHGCCVYISPDENAEEMTEHGHIANRPLGLLEPSCMQLRDGRIVMLTRAEWGGYLWRSESRDNGRTWTDAWQTDIPNPSTCLSLVRLADSRIAMIHNATGEKGVRGIRNPMSIWISDDEMDTWSIRDDIIASADSYRPDGWEKGLDQLSYPDGILLDSRLVFVYDRNRRDIIFVEVDID